LNNNAEVGLYRRALNISERELLRIKLTAADETFSLHKRT